MTKSNTPTIFAQRVKQLMKEQRYSQKKICELCGITEAAFSRYMTSDRLPKYNTLSDIARILHTTCDYLTGTEQKYDYDQLKVLLKSSKDDLSRNQKLELIDILMKEYDISTKDEDK